MNKKSKGFIMLDVLYICMMILPVIFGIVLKVLTSPVSEGIQITGARIYYTHKAPVQDLIITEAQINSWIVMISIFGLCLYLTHGLKTRDILKRQHLAEWIIETVDKIVISNMGEYFAGFSPFITAMLFSISAVT